MAEQASCFHCGLPVSDPSRWTLSHQSEQGSFCCPACKAVTEMILAGGLGDYYRYRSEMAERPESIKEKYSLYDETEAQKSFVCAVESDLNIAEATLSIGDIHCAACCWLIETALQQIDGIIEVSVNLSAHKLLVRWHRQKLLLSNIFTCIAQLGYKPFPFQDDLYQKQIEQENRQQLKRLGVAGIAMMQVGMLSIALYAGEFQGIAESHAHFLRWFGLLFCTPVVFYSAQPFFKGAFRSLSQRISSSGFPILSMDVPISLAVASAYIASVYGVLFNAEVYFDSVVMFVFLLLVARYIESRSRQQYIQLDQRAVFPTSIRRLLQANNFQQVESVPFNQMVLNEEFLVLSGETIAFDGVITHGNTQINESAFNGEPTARTASLGDSVLAGTIIGDGPIAIKINTLPTHSYFAKVEALVAKGSAEKPRSALLANRLASKFTLLVLFVAAIAAMYWSIYGDAPSHISFEIVLAILVVSCPCALSLATPAAMTFSYYALRKVGVLLSRGHVQESLHGINHIILDKTGTLTQGKFSLHSIDNFSTTTDAVLCELASALEFYSEHPISKAFTAMASDKHAEAVKVFSGQGVEACIDKTVFRIGSKKFCQEILPTIIDYNDTPHFSSNKTGITQQRIFMADKEKLLCVFILEDKLREGAQATLNYFKMKGLSVEILSGDDEGNVASLANTLGVLNYAGNMTAEKKLQRITALQSDNKRVLMLGDGINDAPVLAQADIAIAMAEGSDLAKLKADGILLGSRLLTVIDLFEHSAKTRRIIYQNITWALLYNCSALPLAAMGFIPPWLAAIGMSLSSILVTLNALRLKNLSKEVCE